MHWFGLKLPGRGFEGYVSADRRALESAQLRTPRATYRRFSGLGGGLDVYGREHRGCYGSVHMGRYLDCPQTRSDTALLPGRRFLGDVRDRADPRPAHAGLVPGQ